MKFSRRKFLNLAVSAATLSALPRVTLALDYPTRPVRIISGFAAGGVVDIVARLIAQQLSERLGHSFVVEDRAGAASNVATELVAHSAPDGYTLMLVTSVNSWNTAIYDNLNFDFLHDIAPVASLTRNTAVMEVNPSFPAKTVPEFIAYAKANPGKINMGSAGPGSGPHLYGELFKRMAGVDLLTVNYRGSGPALPDLISGRLQVMFDIVVSSIEYIRAGKLRALGVTTAKRSRVLPDVPPIGDFVPGYEASGWNGLGAPKNTPAAIVVKLNTVVNAALADPKFSAQLADLGATPSPSSPADFGKFIVDYTHKWVPVIRAAGIKAD